LPARGEELDRVQGFEVGAEDYVLKPFSVRELLLRIKVILRRAAQAEGAPAPSDEVRLGALALNLASHQAWVEGEEVALTLLELKLLATLVARRGKTQSRAALLADVWGYGAGVTAELETRTVDTHIKRLREKLGAAGDLIETIRGVGYRCRRAPDELPGGV
jgi:two-component system phosphate regulon response regulator PhoB